MKNTYIILAIAGVILLAGLFYGLTQFGGNGEDTNTTDVSTTTPTSEQVVTSDNAMPTEELTVPGKNIVQVATDAGNFSTLLAAVQAAGLVETLSSGEYTIFAPTDEAFAKLPEGTLAGLLEDKEALTKILTYHVISGKVLSNDVVNLTTAQTVLGQNLSIKSDEMGVTINNSKVTSTDIEASNGVIHVIDTVLMPE